MIKITTIPNSQLMINDLLTMAIHQKRTVKHLSYSGLSVKNHIVISKLHFR